MPPFAFHFYIFLILVFLPLSSSGNDEWYTSCGALFSCGNITSADYPFWGRDRPQNCGYPEMELECEDGIPILKMMNIAYHILDINQDAKILKIAREDLLEDICLEEFVNTTLDSMLFEYTSGDENVTLLYGCPPTNVPMPAQFTCPVNGIAYKDGHVKVGAEGPMACHASIVVPVSRRFIGQLADFSISLEQAIEEGFEVRWKVDSTACSECRGWNGQCGYDHALDGFTCICPNQSSEVNNTCSTSNAGGGNSTQASQTAPGSSDNKGSVALPIALAAGGAAFAGIGIGWYVFHLRQKKRQQAEQSEQTVQAKSKKAATPPPSNSLETTPWINYSQSIPSYPSLPSRSDLERGSTYFGAHVFSHAELEEATNNFDSSRELGDGGFGRVYYGKLHDGRVVAVKRLYENNFKRVEQFMNEVEILTRLRHKNLVTLYGCTSKRSCELLLVYEFIPNGTVADHIHGKLSNSGLLSWPIRLSIAIETADALAYLHASDVIHRDVKTNNILLDNDFRVKVADFGLSRLFPTDVTHVSTAPQGTPGYVDPEYYQCYQLTEKSDVYSFGVVLIELISSKPAVDTNRHRHDINLANMAVNKIQNHTLHELVDPCLKFETNRHMRRMTTLVAELAFRCLQQERDMRPSMEEVLEALKGIQNEDLNAQKVEVLDIMEDEVGLLKANSPPFSPDSQKWVSSSTTAHSSG